VTAALNGDTGACVREVLDCDDRTRASEHPGFLAKNILNVASAAKASQAYASMRDYATNVAAVTDRTPASVFAGLCDVAALHYLAMIGLDEPSSLRMMAAAKSGRSLHNRCRHGRCRHGAGREV
jgi:hypothetical protein